MSEPIPMSKNPPKWMRQIRLGDIQGYSGASMGTFGDMHELSREAWGPERADGENSGLTLFAYLWRRFGPPIWNSDSYKELAEYILGTPMEGVLLSVYPKAMPASYSVGYLISPEIQEEADRPTLAWYRTLDAWCKSLPEDVSEWSIRDQANRHLLDRFCNEHGLEPRLNYTGWRNQEGLIGQINAALFAAMMELTRPVHVRDVAINAFGRCANPHAIRPARHSPLAGLGIPRKPKPKPKITTTEATTVEDAADV